MQHLGYKINASLAQCEGLQHNYRF